MIISASQGWQHHPHSSRWGSTPEVLPRKGPAFKVLEGSALTVLPKLQAEAIYPGETEVVPCRSLDRLWGHFPPSWSRAHNHSQTALSSCPVKSKKSDSLPSFCPMSVPFDLNRQCFCLYNLMNSLSSDSLVTPLMSSSKHAFSFFATWISWEFSKYSNSSYLFF